MSYLKLNSKDNAVIGTNCQGTLARLMLLQRSLQKNFK